MAWFLNGWFLNCWFLMGRRQWGLEAGRQVEKEGAVTKIEQGRNEGGRGGGGAAGRRGGRALLLVSRAGGWAGRRIGRAGGRAGERACGRAGGRVAGWADGQSRRASGYSWAGGRVDGPSWANAGKVGGGVPKWRVPKWEGSG